MSTGESPSPPNLKVPMIKLHSRLASQQNIAVNSSAHSKVQCSDYTLLSGQQTHTHTHTSPLSRLSKAEGKENLQTTFPPRCPSLQRQWQKSYRTSKTVEKYHSKSAVRSRNDH